MPEPIVEIPVAPAATPAPTTPAPTAPVTPATPSVENAPTATKEVTTLLGEEPKTDEQLKADADAKAIADKAAADAKAEALKNETPEQKVAREKQEADAKAKAVPEKYEIKPPEGMNIDAKSVEALTPIFKELGITQDGAQKLADAYAPHIKNIVEAQRTAAIDAFNENVASWDKETRAMLGAEPAKALAPAAKFINKFAENAEDAKEIRALMQSSGLGSHPKIVALMIKAGKQLGEDNVVDGKTIIPSEGDGINAMYPTMAKT